jgi:hypothetical protein
VTAAITVVGASGPPTSAISARMVTPWRGNWFVDVELDPDIPLVPTGPVTLTIGLVALVGTVDPRASGIMGSRASCRIVGGLNPLGTGWETEIPGLDMANDAGVLNAQVIETAAGLIGEVATVVPPVPVGTHYFLSNGPASRVLRGLDYHVDPITGTTMVQPRIPLPLVDPTSFDVLDFDPIAQRVTLAGDGVLAPGTILVDPRFGLVIVRDVEQVWNADGARAYAWTGNAVTSSRAASALARLAYEACGVTTLRSYRCRVILQGPDGRLALQPIEVGELSPITVLELVPVDFGVPGVTMKIPPGTEVVMHFEQGDPSKPRVYAFADTPAIEVDVTAEALVKILAPSVTIGPVPLPVASAPAVAAVNTALTTFLAALTIYATGIQPVADPGPPPGPVTSPLLAAITTLEGAIAAVAETLPTKVLEAT